MHIVCDNHLYHKAVQDHWFVNKSCVGVSGVLNCDIRSNYVKLLTTGMTQGWKVTFTKGEISLRKHNLKMVSKTIVFDSPKIFFTTLKH